MTADHSKAVLLMGAGTALKRAYSTARASRSSRNVVALEFSEVSVQFKEADFAQLAAYPPDMWAVFVAMSNARLNCARRDLMEAVEARGYQFCSVISRVAVISEDSKSGRNTFIDDLVVVGTGASIADNCWIDARVSIGAGAQIGSSVSIGAGALIGENVRIGENTNVTSGSIIADNITIGRRCELLDARKYQVSLSDSTFVHPLFGNVRIYGSPKAPKWNSREDVLTSPT